MDPVLQGEPELTPRELTLLALVGSGQRLHEAAKQEHLSFYTVRNNLNEVRGKLNARTLTQCVAIAIGYGWLKVIDGEVYVVPRLRS